MAVHLYIAPAAGGKTAFGTAPRRHLDDPQFSGRFGRVAREGGGRLGTGHIAAGAVPFRARWRPARATGYLTPPSTCGIIVGAWGRGVEA